jgi:hypothetical protein
MRTLLEILVLLIYANLAEYAIHRWVLHGWLWHQHENHHKDSEHTVLFVHNFKGALLASLLIGANALLWAPAFGWLPLKVFVFYYFVILEAAHVLIHRLHIWGHHMKHHADLKQGNWNVWIGLGDYLFGTRI